MNRKMLKYIIREYGLSWSICRLLYILKIKAMKLIPAFEKIFEKKSDNKENRYL